MEQIVHHSLAGRRFAVIGFDPSEADTIIEALGTVRGTGHMVNPTPGIPGLNSFSPFDACFINASVTSVGEQLTPIEMLAHSRKPAVIVGFFEDLVRYFPAVADVNREFVLRPYQPQDLLLRAFRVLRFAESVEKTIESQMESGGRRVVVADDDESTVTMLTTILKHFRFACEVAHNGAEAFEMARKKRPELVLLDIAMPRMDGFEALTALRNDMATRSTPVILVTGRSDEAEVVKGFALGAADYITKPFTSGELMARVNRVLREPEEF